MIQFLENSKPIFTSDREDLIDYYTSQGYEICPIIYNVNWNFINPIWNGTEWTEGATPEEIAEQELEKQKILKQQQYEELLPTDWYVIRFIERGIAIPEEIKTQRQAILDKYSI